SDRRVGSEARNDGGLDGIGLGRKDRIVVREVLPDRGARRERRSCKWVVGVGVTGLPAACDGTRICHLLSRFPVAMVHCACAPFAALAGPWPGSVPGGFCALSRTAARIAS